MFILDVFTMIGGVVVCIVMACMIQYFITWTVKKIKDILSRQRKIRFLCRHEWREYRVHSHFDEKSNDWYDRHMLICRRCGKRKQIDILEKDAANGS